MENLTSIPQISRTQPRKPPQSAYRSSQGSLLNFSRCYPCLDYKKKRFLSKDDFKYGYSKSSITCRCEYNDVSGEVIWAKNAPKLVSFQQNNTKNRLSLDWRERIFFKVLENNLFTLLRILVSLNVEKLKVFIWDCVTLFS